MDQKTFKRATEWLMCLTFIVWIAWDIIAYKFGGNADTESATTALFSYLYPSIPYTVGALIGHLFFQLHPPSKMGVTPPWFKPYCQFLALSSALTWFVLDLATSGKDFVTQAFLSLSHNYAFVPFCIGVLIGTLTFQMDEPTE